MEPYLLYGLVLPERAQLSLQCDLEFSHLSTGAIGNVRLNIILNQVAIWIESDHEWDIFTLRNVAKNIVQTQLAIVGFVKGLAYDCEVTRILNRGLGIDYVFGIDTPVIANRRTDADLSEAVAAVRAHTAGPLGILVSRCLADLVSAMRNADDTGFYCYRAIESLRHHCAAQFGLQDAGKASQWQKFRDVSGSSEESIRVIKTAADPLRHGEVIADSSDERAELLAATWDIVEGYLRGA
jgi:hypothetical protein